MRFVQTGDTVIDGGANIGAFTIPLAKQVGSTGHVYAFEAQRVLSQILHTNVVMNELFNVHVLNQALGANFGTVSVPIVRRSQLKETSMH